MRAATISIWVAVIATTYAIGCQLSRGDSIRTSRVIIERSIAFDDLAPAGLALKQCWNAMGMDSKERVYIGFTSKRSDGRQNLAVFRYDPTTGDRRFPRTFMDVSQAAGNLRPGEEIPKGHTRMLEIDGKIYMGSQGFHDLKAAIDTLSDYRGSHSYAYDLSSGALEEVSRSLPNGVVTEHQGIIALSQAPGIDYLVGLAHPLSDIVLFDYKHGRVHQIVLGIPWRLGNPLSREVVVTRHLGYFLPKEEHAAGERIDYLFGITQSADEKRIYGIPRRSRHGTSNLYAYEIDKRAVTLVGQVEPGVYTGSHMRDSRGNIFYASFDGDSWEGNARLAILRP